MGPPKRIVFCSNVGGGVFGELQVAAWREAGWDAHLHSAVSLGGYWKAKSGRWSRLKLRWDMYVRYPLMLRSVVRKGRQSDVFVAVTNPFFVPSIAARAARRSGAKVINLVYDLYPDALIFGGGWSKNNPACRYARSSTRGAFRACDATVFLGDRLRSYAESTYGGTRRAVVIPVGTDAKPFRGYQPAPRETDRISLLYSGHMGRLHEWETLCQALSGKSPPANLSIEIAADGPGAAALRSSSVYNQSIDIKFTGTKGSAEWHQSMLAADIALVTMRQGAEKVVMPSKTYSAMAAGQAILAVCPRQSDLADLVEKHGCGWVIETGKHEDLVALLQRLSGSKAEILAKRNNAYATAHRHFSMEATAVDWGRLFESVYA